MVKREQEVGAIEAARRLGIDPGYLYLLLRAGRIAARKVEGHWLVSVTAIEIRKQRVRGRSDAPVGLLR